MKSLRWVGLVFSLLIVGVLGGLMAPLPSEAMTLEIAGQTNVSVTSYVCGTQNQLDPGYASCWFITTGPLVRRTIGAWYVEDVGSNNRARVRIQDLGGTGGISNIDLMNITGIKLTPVNSGTVTTHVKINHSFSIGQNKGDYWFGLGVTGNFDPIGQDTVLGDHFILTGTGTFNSGNDPVDLGTIDRGAFSGTQIAGNNGPISKTIAPRSVKNPCDSNGSGLCKPTILYDLTITSVNQDSLVLTDSGIAAGVSVQDNCAQKPQTPSCKALKNAGAVLETDAKHGSNGHTCVDTDTCGTIVIKKTLAKYYDFQGTGGACGQGGLCPNTLILQDIQTFGFDGTGFGIYPFDITTDGVPLPTGSTGSHAVNFLETTSSGSGTRIIRETVFPTAFDPGSCSPANPCVNDVYWYTKTVSCTPASGGPEGFVYSTHNGLRNVNQNLDGTLQRSGYVEVTSLAVNPAGGPVVQLTCTFQNGIFELLP